MGELPRLLHCGQVGVFQQDVPAERLGVFWVCQLQPHNLGLSHHTYAAPGFVHRTFKQSEGDPGASHVPKIDTSATTRHLSQIRELASLYG